MNECAICGEKNLKYSVEVHAGCLATITNEIKVTCICGKPMDCQRVREADKAKIDMLAGLLRKAYANLPLDSTMRKEVGEKLRDFSKKQYSRCEADWD